MTYSPELGERAIRIVARGTRDWPTACLPHPPVACPVSRYEWLSVLSWAL